MCRALGSTLVAFVVAGVAAAGSAASFAPPRMQAPGESSLAGDEAARRAAVDRELGAALDGGRELGAALARANASGLGVLALVVGDRAPAQGAEALSFQERLVLGIALADPRVRARTAGRYVTVAITADPEARRAYERAVEPQFELEREFRPPALAELAPPALALLDAEGRLVRALARLAPLDAGTVAAWLDGGGVPVGEGDDADAAAYMAAARAPHAAAESSTALRALATGSGPWATKARARLAFPRELAAFELLRPPQNEGVEHRVSAEARARLLEVQRPDGAFDGADPRRARLATVAAALAFHRSGDHDAGQRAVAWLEARWSEGGVDDPRARVLWLDVHLARHGAGWSRLEDATAAAVALQALALPTGGFSETSGEPRASIVTTGFALDALYRAREVGTPVDVDVLAGARAVLEAARAESGRYAELAPRAGDGRARESEAGDGTVGDVGASGARTLGLAADAALARAGVLKRRMLADACNAALGELADARAAEGFARPDLRQGAYDADARAWGWLAYARMTAAAPGRPFSRRDGRFRRDLLRAARADSTWGAACDEGWVTATALALVALEETR